MQEHFSPLTATVSLLVAPVTPVTSCSRKEPIFWCYMLVLSTQKTETRRICANTMAKSPSSLTPTHSLSLSSATPLPPISLLFFRPSGNKEGWVEASTVCTGKWVRYSKRMALRCRAAHTSRGQGDRAEVLKNPRGHIT